MEAVVERIGDCCSTGAESKTCKLFFGRNSFRINASYDSGTRNSFRINLGHDKEFKYVFLFRSTALQFRHYYCCSGGCCSTGAEPEE
uniref:Phospholipid scramblase n=1 Tax=Strongyloides stercoralis TaxID=6248 RepID=A0A0K0EK85_STRER